MKLLLNLQEKDLDRRQAEAQLAQFPLEIQDLNNKIQVVKNEKSARSHALKEMEVERKRIDTELKAEEDKIVKYKNQQMQVKKNEEYQAFTQQIDDAQNRVYELEDEELTLMEKIDQEKEAFKSLDQEADQRIAELEGQIKHVKEKSTSVEGKIAVLRENYNQARTQVDPSSLSKYDQVAQQLPRGPFVVALENHKCMGCHLKVSNDVISATRKPGDTLPQCDSCSRILYWMD